jgi:hypothetical protein
MDLTELQLKQGAVLARAHKLIETFPAMTVGQAVKKAIEHSDIAIPQEVEDTMVVALARLLLNGFPSKVDA